MKPIVFLREYLEQIRPLEMGDEAFLNYHYIDEHLDSFEIIRFIIAIEEAFGIHLASEDTESEAFRTIGGVVEIIERKCGA